MDITQRQIDDIKMWWDVWQAFERAGHVLEPKCAVIELFRFMYGTHGWRPEDVARHYGVELPSAIDNDTLIANMKRNGLLT